MASVKWDGGKYKGATEAKAHFRHNETEQRKQTEKHSNTDIDRSRTAMNFSVIGRSYANRCKMYDEAIADAATHSKRKMRADAVTCLGLCTYAPAELPEEKCAEWFIKVHSIMVDMFGVENVIDTDVHFDEVHEYYDSEQDEIVRSRVHAHTNVIPRTKDGRLCCKEIYTRSNCVKLNGLIEDMTQSEYGIQFQTGAKTKGTRTVEQLKADTLKATLEEESRAREHRHELVTKNAELNKRNTALCNELKQQEARLEKAKESVKEIEKQILRKQRKLELDKAIHKSRYQTAATENGIVYHTVEHIGLARKTDAHVGLFEDYARPGGSVADVGLTVPRFQKQIEVRDIVTVSSAEITEHSCLVRDHQQRAVFFKKVHKGFGSHIVHGYPAEVAGRNVAQFCLQPGDLLSGNVFLLFKGFQLAL